MKNKYKTQTITTKSGDKKTVGCSGYFNRRGEKLPDKFKFLFIHLLLWEKQKD